MSVGALDHDVGERPERGPRPAADDGAEAGGGPEAGDPAVEAVDGPRAPGRAGAIEGRARSLHAPEEIPGWDVTLLSPGVIGAVLPSAFGPSRASTEVC
jgi:hypothetical protein